MPCTAWLKSQDAPWQRPLTSPGLKRRATSEVRRRTERFKKKKVFPRVINHPVAYHHLLVSLFFFPGCTGAMAYEFTKAHPGFSVTVFDLPAVVELSERFHPLHTDNRVSFVAGVCVFIITVTPPSTCDRDSWLSPLSSLRDQETSSRTSCPKRTCTSLPGSSTTCLKRKSIFC